MGNNNQAGKGDKYRPVDKKIYDKNYDEIDWKSKKKSVVSTVNKSNK